MLNKLLILLTESALAQSSNPVNLLVPLGAGTEPARTEIATIGEYVKTIFPIFLSVAITLAVVMITWGGLQHTLSMKPGGKSEATERITSALWGLLLALVAWIILNEINPLINTIGGLGNI